MKYLIAFCGVLSFSLTAFGQQTITNGEISSLDSILLKKFCHDFKTAINSGDKDKLISLCKFPFYCQPCVEDSTLKRNNHVAIKVTKRIFNKSQYKYFLDAPIKDKVNSSKGFDINIFYGFNDDRNKFKGYGFSYTIISPSKYGEGIQGFITVEKTNGTFKITSIYTVP